jgi:hypothetical protein
MWHPGRSELLAQKFRGREFFAAELRVLVEVTPEPREFGVDPRQLFLDSPRSRIRRFAGCRQRAHKCVRWPAEAAVRTEIRRYFIKRLLTGNLQMAPVEIPSNEQ